MKKEHRGNGSDEEAITSAETGYAEQQTLRRRGRGYVLTTEFVEVLQEDGVWISAHKWRLKIDPSLPPLEMWRFEPFELLPRDRLRHRQVSRRITHAEAAAWFSENVVERIVPRKFHKDFALLSVKLHAVMEKIKELESRAAREPKKPDNASAPLNYRQLLLTLLDLPANASDKAIAAEIALCG